MLNLSFVISPLQLEDNRRNFSFEVLSKEDKEKQMHQHIYGIYLTLVEFQAFVQLISGYFFQ
jgi:hypothetical protein